MSENKLREKAVRTPNEYTVEQQATTGDEEVGSLEAVLGYKAELHKNRSMFTLLFQSLAIAAIPYGEGILVELRCLASIGHLLTNVEGLHF